MKTLTLRVAQERLERIANISPIRAIEELIWNSLDADATNISVSFTQNSINGIEKIYISDNGHGIDYETAEFAFGSLGGSKKKGKTKSPGGRLFHGKEGEGRYKAFRLGSNIQWKSRFKNKKKEIQDINIQAYAATRDKPELSDLRKSDNDTTGVDVIISSISDNCSSLLDDKASDYLTIQLASYLFGYSNIRIEYDGKKINPNEILANKAEIPLREDNDETLLEANLLICEWTKGKRTGLFLCNEDGIVIHKADYAGCSDFSYSAYLKSPIFSKLDKDDLLSLEDIHPNVAILKNAAKEEIRKYFKKRMTSKAAELVAKLRHDKIYPYHEEPTNDVEKAERQVFDICAVKIHQSLPNFQNTDRRQKEFTLELIKQAIESGPSSLKTILQKVLELSDDEKDDLAEILEYTSLPALMKIGSLVANRLHFLNGLEQIVADKQMKDYLKERCHLQHIIESELWIFGENYSFCSPKGGDITLKNVLEAHLNILGRTDLIPFVQDVKSLDDIPDICIYQQFCNGSGDVFENLVIELKRPGKLTEKNLSQIKRYARKVADDSRFDKAKTKWNFLLINTDFNDDVEAECQQEDRDYGHIIKNEHYNIWVRRWGDIIQECKGRIEFVRKQMDFSVQNNEEGINYLRNKYSEYLPDEILNAV